MVELSMRMRVVRAFFADHIISPNSSHGGRCPIDGGDVSA